MRIDPLAGLFRPALEFPDELLEVLPVVDLNLAVRRIWLKDIIRKDPGQRLAQVVLGPLETLAAQFDLGDPFAEFDSLPLLSEREVEEGLLPLGQIFPLRLPTVHKRVTFPEPGLELLGVSLLKPLLDLLHRHLHVLPLGNRLHKSLNVSYSESEAVDNSLPLTTSSASKSARISFK